MIKKPVVYEIAYKTYAINEYGTTTFFLLEGKERSLVIDAGCGWANARAIVEDMTKLPYDVVLTHGHGDHIGSAPLFDRVYLQQEDHAMAADRESNNRMKRHFPETMRPYGTFEIFDVDFDKVPFYENNPEFLPLEDGRNFELGERSLEVMHVPGHTRGSVVLFDAKNRILFSGDALNGCLGLSACSVTTSLRALLRLKEREGEYDRNFNSHVAWGAELNCTSQKESTLDDCIYILKGVLKGSIKGITPPSGGIFSSSAEASYGAVKLFFNADRLIDDGETPLNL